MPRDRAVDGPYGSFPLVHVYRCMAACTPNGEIETIFPLCGGRTHYCLSAGDVRGDNTHSPQQPIAAHSSP